MSVIKSKDLHPKSKSSPVSQWTRSSDGEFVDWLDPAYRNGGSLHLVLPGETYHKLDSAVRQKRIKEYYLLLRRQNKGA